MDNAIQVSLRIKDEKRSLKVMIKQYKNDLLIEVSNKFNLKEIESRAFRKDDGLGMKNIAELINEIGGIYRSWHEEDTYYVTVVLFNVYRK